MGRIMAPFGVKGWVRVEPYTAATRNLLDYPTWWIGVGREHGWQAFDLTEGRPHGRALVVKLEGCDDRDAAGLLSGRMIAVPREALPLPPEGEYYWVDLIGLAVVNMAGQALGRVTAILETGANDVLVVADGGRERLVPFTAQVVREVDYKARVLRVDWGAED
jgi:16S rRNA processing protein RimM